MINIEKRKEKIKMYKQKELEQKKLERKIKENGEGICRCRKCKKLFYEKDGIKDYKTKKIIHKECREKFLKKIRKKVKKNRKKINLQISIRKKNDYVFKIKCNIRRSIHYGFKKINFKKQTKTENILGCSFTEFKFYIESKFEHWMNWDNYGKYNGEFNYGWDLDHIIQIRTAKTIEDVIKLNHYTNFQPLCSKINRDIKR